MALTSFCETELLPTGMDIIKLPTVSGVPVVFHAGLPPLPRVGQQGTQGFVIGPVATFAQKGAGFVGGIKDMIGGVPWRGSETPPWSLHYV